MAVSTMNSSRETERKLESLEESWEEIGKEGLLKQIVVRGTSWQTPCLGDEVEVHYSGKVHGGVCLDSSRDKGTSFRFKLGQCEVIKGFDKGVATMKKGERAIFKIPPNLAYGETGSEPLVPPNASLIFDIEMISWRTIRDITGNGGVLKKITREGEGWATPRDADEVLVKYEACLEDGSTISKSDDGVEFCIGDDFLCSAMSEAVKTMRKGEKAELLVKFAYFSMENGISVPPDSKLTIDLELISWKRVIDVTGDKKVLKKIVKVGEGLDLPNEGCLVKVVCIGRLEDGTVFDRKGTDEDPFTFTCLEGQVNEGLDRSIMTMKKGEEALVTINAAEYLSNHEVENLINADSYVRYEIKLIDFTKDKPFWKMNSNEKLETCEQKKTNGNLLFKAGKFWGASKKYDKAANYVEYNHEFTEDKKRLAKSLLLSCYLNNAACQLKLGNYPEASRLCTKVLEVDPMSVKSLFRRSQAYLETSELEKAEDDIKRALSIDPNNREVKLEYKKLKEKQREYAKYQAEVFSTMFSKLG
ncbi:hypothetical protein ACFE04_030614 [Oxalis oulophora]